MDINTFITLGAGASAVVVACIAVRQNSKIARARNTLEFLRDYNSEPRVDSALKLIREIPNKTQDEVRKIYDDEDGQQRADFLFLMNKFELLAAGLKHNIYEKELVKNLFGHDISIIYRNSERLVKYIREKDKDDKAYDIFEALAKETEYRDLKGKR